VRGGRGDGDGVAAPVAHGEAFEDVVVYEAAGLAAGGVAVAVLGVVLAGVKGRGRRTRSARLRRRVGYVV
jgi:branched-subunit amino acid permease